MTVSGPLWLPRTDLPLFPLLSLPNITATSLNLMGLVFLLLGCVGVLWNRFFRVASFLCCLGVVLLIGSDMTRWQPWLYHFGALFLCMVLQRADTKNRWNVVSWMAAWMLVAVYFWSGWHKIHWHSGASSVMLLAAILPAKWQAVVVEQWGAYVGLVLGIVESLLALGLVFRFTRLLATLALTVMHVLIVVSLLVLNHDINVIPWNAACVAMLWLLFGFQTRSLFGLKHWMKSSVQNMALSSIEPSSKFNQSKISFLWVRVLLLAVFFGAIPLMHSWSVTGPNASFALYSGNYVFTQLLIPDNVYKGLPASSQSYAKPVLEVPWKSQQKSAEVKVSLHMLDMHAWSMKRFRTTVPPSAFYFRRVHQALCRTFSSRPILVVVRGKRVWGKVPQQFQIDDCQHRWSRGSWPASPP